MDPALPLTADGVTLALISGGPRMVSAIGEGAFIEMRGDASLLITGLPVANLNGVLTVRTSATRADVAHLLDIAAQTGFPHRLSIRPGCSDEVTDLAKERGLVEDEPVPLMAMPRDMILLDEAVRRPGLSIHRLRPEESAIHVSIAAQGFEAPVEIFERLVPSAALAWPGVHAYVGTVDGEAVTTAMGSTNGDYVGIFAVATLTQHRGLGYGAAITAHTVLDGFKSGASFAYLQSSAMGLKVYERLGFRTLERWSVWVTRGSESH